MFDNIAWWAQVTLTPDDRRTIVLSRGIPHGANGLIPIGGHMFPSSTVGASLLWKNAQKNEKKKHTSEIMNRITPNRIPFETIELWYPCILLSRVTSRHHCHMVPITTSIPNIKIFIPHPWNHLTRPLVIIIAPIDPVIGHGLISTK